MRCCHPNGTAEGRRNYVYPPCGDICDCGGFKERLFKEWAMMRGLPETFDSVEKYRDEVAQEVGWEKGSKETNYTNGEKDTLIFYKPKE
jgi:hypothetical protein